jgi:hypothetical protein
MDPSQAAAFGKLANVLSGQAKSLEKIAEALAEIEKHLRSIDERGATSPR